MNRRRFVIGVGSAFAMSVLAGTANALPSSEHYALRKFVGSGNPSFLFARVARHHHVQRAEKERQLAIREPLLEPELGEISLVDWGNVPLPDGLRALPGTLATFTTVAGAAAVERTTLIGAFRREALLWTLTTVGEDTAAIGDGMIELAQDLTGRQIRSHRVTNDDAGQRSGWLWDLLPLPADLRGEMTVIREEWPGRLWERGT